MGCEKWQQVLWTDKSKSETSALTEDGLYAKVPTRQSVCRQCWRIRLVSGKFGTLILKNFYWGFCQNEETHKCSEEHLEVIFHQDEDPKHNGNRSHLQQKVLWPQDIVITWIQGINVRNKLCVKDPEKFYKLCKCTWYWWCFKSNEWFIFDLSFFCWS